MEKAKQTPQAGVFLLALMVNIATIMTLAAGALGCFTLFAKMHETFVGDLVLHEQLRFAAGNIMRDIAYAERVEISSGQTSVLTLWRMGKKIVYEVRGKRLIKDTQPLTGEDQRYPVVIEAFTCKRMVGGMVLLKISAYSQKNTHVFSVETGAVMMNSEENLNIINRLGA